MGDALDRMVAYATDNGSVQVTVEQLKHVAAILSALEDCAGLIDELRDCADADGMRRIAGPNNRYFVRLRTDVEAALNLEIAR